jgi:hypothetical protein
MPFGAETILTPFSPCGDYTIGWQKKFKSPIGVIVP